MNPETLIFLVACVLMLGLIAGVRAWRLSRGEAQALARLDASRRAGAFLPPTLHPVIDPNRCISSGSCTTACPQANDVLGLVNGRGTLLNPNVCIGHGRCAAECPVGAIKLVFGTAERGVDIPHLSPRFETNVPGLYIAGELGGMGLIANAVRQARRAMENLHASLKTLPKGDTGAVDVAIIGAGPAGLSAALWAIEQGLSYRLLEKEDTFGGSILHYPRRKLVLTEPVKLPLMGAVLPKSLSKEELLEVWQRAVTEFKVRIEGGVRVDDIRTGPDGIFRISSSSGEVRARKVLMCIGRRGIPKRLEVPGEEAENVAYSLLEPSMYAGKRVLVVGGGDSAVEAACMLAEDTDARVALSYRGTALSRAKPENVARFERAVAAGRIEALWKSEVKEIRPDAVHLTLDGQPITRPNDDVLVFLGGTLPMDMLSRAGVRMQRHHGEEVARSETDDALSSEDVFEHITKQRKGEHLVGVASPAEAVRQEGRISRVVLPIVGVGLVLGLLTIGGEYYFAPPDIKEHNEALAVFSPSGVWGQTVGVLALFFMFTNFMYYVRKESKLLKGFGSIHLWMRIHVFSGLLTGAVALIHACLFARNLFAVVLYLSLGIVVLTGLAGRYIYGFVPLDPRGRPLAHAALVSLSGRMARDFGRHYEHLEAAARLRQLLDLESTARTSILGALYGILIVWPLRYLRVRQLVGRAAHSIEDRDQRLEFSHFAREMLKMRFQMDYLAPLKRLLGLWRSSHAILAVFLLILVIVHVVIEFWVGYRWIF